MSAPYSVLTLEGGVWGPGGPNRKTELLWERPGDQEFQSRPVIYGQEFPVNMCWGRHFYKNSALKLPRVGKFYI